MFMIERCGCLARDMTEVCSEKEAEVVSICLAKRGDGEIVSYRQNNKYSKILISDKCPSKFP